MTLLLPEVAHEATARVEAGLWMADCPRPFCRNAEHCGAHPISQHVGGLREPSEPGSTTGTFRCNHCTWEGLSRWPSRDERVAIERLLAMRPVPTTRNWLPSEQIRDLVAENVQYGVISVHDQFNGWAEAAAGQPSRWTEQNGGH